MSERNHAAGSGDDLMASAERLPALKESLLHLPSWDLSPRQVCDLELLLNGAFAPLEGYLTRRDFEAVLADMRLANGRLCPLPVCLDVSETFAGSLRVGDRIALRHPEGMALAVMTIQDVWTPDRRVEAEAVFSTLDPSHPGVGELLERTGPVYLGGPLEGLELPPHHTYRHLRHSPAQLRAEFERLGWKRVVAFQTRNPMHRAHVELTQRAAARHGANILIHPVVGRAVPGDIDYFSRVRCYLAALGTYPAGSAMLSLLPLAMRMAGPREAVWHALIRRNYGATHFIVGRDHAGPRDAGGKPFYGPAEAQDLAVKHAAEIGIEVIAFDEMVFVEERGEYMFAPEVPAGMRVLGLSGTELRRRLREGLDVPPWFSYPEVVRELRRSFPPRSRQGFTVFFTGLSGAGKSTIANIVAAKLMEIDRRPVTLLDGDIVRKNLSSELGFSREHRDLNILRIGFVAGEITKNRGVAICAPIAPYRRTRRAVREEVSARGGFIEVYVSTPLHVCEARDRKGLYAKARAGLLKGLTGIDDPYETPDEAEIVIDTTTESAEDAAGRIVLFLETHGYIGSESSGAE